MRQAMPSSPEPTPARCCASDLVERQLDLFAAEHPNLLRHEGAEERHGD